MRVERGQSTDRDVAAAAMEPGQPAPLGATAPGFPAGVNFALWAPRATRVELCLFDADDVETRYELPGFSRGVWHGFLPGAGSGLRYGYRVHGEYDPARGLRFNHNKLLIDPYARALDGTVVHDGRLYDHNQSVGDWQIDTRDSAPVMPKSVVRVDDFDWRGTVAPRIARRDSVIYEAHVRGFTRRHPEVPELLRGTYLGLAEPVVIDYLQRLGITTLELMPCAAFVSEPMLAGRGLSNYWGYNPIAYSAPHGGYAVDDPVSEFQTMVRALHGAGIEVIVDVVYNHTAEGGARGPTLSFRGIDNPGYYLLRHHDRSAYVNNSGCGNSLASHHPAVLRLIMDSLRYWVQVLQVDGFRFDLAPSLGRVHGEFDRNAPFFQALHQDPVLSGVKLIAEPWDVGHAGYRLGQFPPGWSEWNDQYRKNVRSFWRGDVVPIGELAAHLSGSSDTFVGRGPEASVNYVASHDGFTLLDLVSYTERHNEANAENNNDGERDNRSWNRGVEGPSDDAAIVARRALDRRNLLATVLLSQGVPMLQAGDEIGRSQQGNNNAYCQDNEISWIDWRDADWELARFVGRLIELRKANRVLRRSEFLHGPLRDHAAIYDVLWLTEAGVPMQLSDWHDPTRRHIAMLFRGDLNVDEIDPRMRLRGHDAMVLINGTDARRDFLLPPPPAGGHWRLALDSARPADSGSTAADRSRYSCAATSIVLLLGHQP